MKKVKYYNSITKVPQLIDKVDQEMLEVEQNYKFRTNDYYNSLIDWNDENDPIKNIIIPRKEENIQWGKLDASNEHIYQPVKGLEHKYSSTALLLCNDVCGAYCRFCFRKRLFQNENEEVEKNTDQGIEYIANNPSITNVLLTGGDPLMMSNKRIQVILEQLSDIEHVKIVRFGTKMLAFNPFRLMDDDLFNILEQFNSNKQIYFMLHYNHIKELTEESIAAIKFLRKAGVSFVNQTPIIKGVNDDAKTIRELHNKLSFVGVIPYYIFVCRPTAGNYTYALPIENGYEIALEASRNSSGLAKNARFIISHEKGKHQILGLDDNFIYIQKHNVTDVESTGKILIAKRNPNAYWLDDYEFINDLESETRIK